MSVFEDSISQPTETSVRSRIVAFALGAGLAISNWRIVDVGNQIMQSVVNFAFAQGSLIPIYIRGFASLDTATDPGDPDPFDPGNVAQPPASGFLSNMGANVFDTERQGADFATGPALFVNAGPGSRNISPEGLIWTWTVGSPPSPAPTYTNLNDPTIYVNFDGTVTVPAGSSIVLPVTAQVQGAFASAPPNALSLTTTLVGCSSTNPSAIIGNDREDILVFIKRCRQAPARLSLAGPSATYEYLAAKNLDGTPLLNAAVPPVATGITRAQVTQSSATGIVSAYFASDAGAAIADDVTAANANIEAHAFAVPDAITYTGVAATEVTIHVAGTARVRAGVGVSAIAAAQGIVAALAAAQKSIPVGGFDQVSGSGVVYRSDLQAIAKSGYPGLYDVIITTPAASDVAVPLGHVAVIGSDAGDGLGSADWIVTVVS